MSIKHKIGQIWEECDPRFEPRRRVRIVRIEGAFCMCVPVAAPGRDVAPKARSSRINVGTLRHPPGSDARSGYRLVEDV